MNSRSEFEKAVYDGKFRVLISQEKIETRIKELGKRITEDYRDKNPIMIGVLNGSFIFIADLVRSVELDLEIDFIKISSYGDAQVSSGRVQMLKEINADITNRHVLLVEDIVDTGLSVQFLLQRLSALEPLSIEFVSLLHKKENIKIPCDIKYVGFEIPNEFVIGYGLDHKQVLRNLPAVYVMD